MPSLQRLDRPSFDTAELPDSAEPLVVVPSAP
jgi:hypothetical protein